MFAIFKREFLSFFRTPSGYVALALFSFLSGYIFVSQFTSGSVSIASEITTLRSFFMILVPIVTMSLFSEDKRRGTEVLYYTTPTNLSEVVLGKFLAALALFGVMFLNVILHMLITIFSGGVVDSGSWGAVIVYFALTCLFVSLGVFASAVTDSQIISAIFSFILVLLITLISTISSLVTSAVNSLLSAEVFGLESSTVTSICDNINNVIVWFDPLTKTNNYRYGVFEIAPLVFCISVAAIFIFLTYQVLEKKRWSQS